MVILQNKCTDIPSTEMDCKTLKFATKKMQFSKLNIFKKISVLFVYVNKTPGNSETLEIGETLKKEKATVILGDFNLNTDEEEGKKKVKDLCRILDMDQVNNERTTKQSTLDLIFKKKDMREIDFMSFVFQNLYSDHSCIGFRSGIDLALLGDSLQAPDVDFVRHT